MPVKLPTNNSIAMYQFLETVHTPWRDSNPRSYVPFAETMTTTPPLIKHYLIRVPSKLPEGFNYFERYFPINFCF
jgi:hypothetical protein